MSLNNINNLTVNNNLICGGNIACSEIVCDSLASDSVAVKSLFVNGDNILNRLGNVDNDIQGIAESINLMSENKVDISYVDNRFTALIGGASQAFDTLNEIQNVLEGNVGSIGDIFNILSTKAIDVSCVHIEGNETINGSKQFNGNLIVNGQMTANNIAVMPQHLGNIAGSTSNIQSQIDTANTSINSLRPQQLNITSSTVLGNSTRSCCWVMCASSSIINLTLYSASSNVGKLLFVSNDGTANVNIIAPSNNIIYETLIGTFVSSTGYILPVGASICIATRSTGYRILSNTNSLTQYSNKLNNILDVNMPLSGTVSRIDSSLNTLLNAVSSNNTSTNNALNRIDSSLNSLLNTDISVNNAVNRIDSSLNTLRNTDISTGNAINRIDSSLNRVLLGLNVDSSGNSVMNNLRTSNMTINGSTVINGGANQFPLIINSGNPGNELYDAVIGLNASSSTSQGLTGMFMTCNANAVSYILSGKDVSGSNLLFGTDPGTDSATLIRMVINRNGNVGIGANNPSERLVVNGNAVIMSNASIWGNASVTGTLNAPTINIGAVNVLDTLNNNVQLINSLQNQVNSLQTQINNLIKIRTRLRCVYSSASSSYVIITQSNIQSVTRHNSGVCGIVLTSKSDVIGAWTPFVSVEGGTRVNVLTGNEAGLQSYDYVVRMSADFGFSFMLIEQ